MWKCESEQHHKKVLINNGKFRDICADEECEGERYYPELLPPAPPHHHSPAQQPGIQPAVRSCLTLELGNKYILIDNFIFLHICRYI